MSKLSVFFQELFQKNIVVVKQDNKNGIADFKNNEIGTKKYITINVTDTSEVQEIYESVINKNSSVNLREAIIPIEALIHEGKFYYAIQKYQELIASSQFDNYSIDEKFLIYNGLLNCYINSDASDGTIDFWKVKIQALGIDLKEIHRYYYLLGIRELKKGNIPKAFAYNNQSLNAKPDYINALVAEILLKTINNNISYDDAKILLEKFLENKGLSVNNLASIHSCYGDIAFHSKKYDIAKEHHLISNELSNSICKEIIAAICQYCLSFKELKEDGRVELDQIDFIILYQAKKSFEDIYNRRTEDTIQTIVKMSFPFYFNILALESNHAKILEIYSTTTMFINNTMTDILQHVVEAQVINGVLDEERISLFSEFEQIRFEVLYYEKKENYSKVIELLTPIFELGEVKNNDEKTLLLAFLNAIKEENDFKKYMHYYQKFNCHLDEVLRMNYIQFLKKRDQKDLVFDEIRKITELCKNGFVLFELLLIYLDYQLNDELEIFFKKVDNGDYNIIGVHLPFVFYHKMIYLLNQKKFDDYFRLYETSDLSILNDNYRLVLKINYYMFKHDLENLAISFYENFLYTQDHNELLNAVQIKLQINQYYDAEFYIEQVNPMELEKPEYYYMFKAIILEEKQQIEEAFNQLEIVLESLDVDLGSPFHQFYCSFNMNNNRTNEAFRYMGEYYAKNPNPSWFKLIQYSDDDSGSDLIAKLEKAIGGKRDLKFVNEYFVKGWLGISSYNKLVATGIEEMLIFKHYPFSRITISRDKLIDSKSKIEFIDNKVIIDATTLTIFAASNALSLLEVFDEILIPYSTLEALTERRTRTYKENVIKVLDYIARSPSFKKFAVDESLKIKTNIKEIVPEDILDCISITDKLDVPFLNTEVVVNFEFKLDRIIDVNTLFIFIKEKHTDKRVIVAEVITKMRELGLDFISFDADDIYFAYKSFGVERIDPFLKMGMNADYKTFSLVYVGFLAKLYKHHTTEEFVSCSKKIIHFMDHYIGKTRYYMSCISINYPNIEDVLSKLIQKTSVMEIMIFNALCSHYEGYIQIIETPEFKKIISICSAFIIFVIGYVSIFSNDNERNNYIEFLKQNLSINGQSDIDYILTFINNTRLK